MDTSTTSPDELESQYETFFSALDQLEQQVLKMLEQIPDASGAAVPEIITK